MEDRPFDLQFDEIGYWSELKLDILRSASFAGRGQTRNIELGVLITDDTFAHKLAGHWRSLVSRSLVERYSR